MKNNHPLTNQLIEELKRLTPKYAVTNDCGHLTLNQRESKSRIFDSWLDEQIEKFEATTQPHQFLTSGYLKHDPTERRLFISKDEKELRDILEQLRWDKDLEVGMIPAPVKVEVSREIVIKINN